MNNIEYFVTKLTFQQDHKLIQDITVYESNGTALSPSQSRNRNWMVDRVNNGYSISIMTPHPGKSESWLRGSQFSYIGGYFSWDKELPKNITCRKTFVSFYHKDDQVYRDRFNNLFGDLIVSKSVEDGEIDSENSAEYIKKLIQNDCLCDTTVLVVLIGPKTKCRKHVDWEISGALNMKVGDKYAGLLGIILPTHPDFGPGKAISDLMPARLADNLRSGYATIYDWTEDRVKMQEYIEQAFATRTTNELKFNNSRIQMTNNTCS